MKRGAACGFFSNCLIRPLSRCGIPQRTAQHQSDGWAASDALALTLRTTSSLYHNTTAASTINVRDWCWGHTRAQTTATDQLSKDGKLSQQQQQTPTTTTNMQQQLRRSLRAGTEPSCSSRSSSANSAFAIFTAASRACTHQQLRRISFIR